MLEELMGEKVVVDLRSAFVCLGTLLRQWFLSSWATRHTSSSQTKRLYSGMGKSRKPTI